MVVGDQAWQGVPLPALDLIGKITGGERPWVAHVVGEGMEGCAVGGVVWNEERVCLRLGPSAAAAWSLPLRPEDVVALLQKG